MQAIILAAGMGKRLKELTNNNTKCMVKVNGVSLIERMLNQLDNLNLSKIVIVVGYKAIGLIEHIHSLSVSTPIVFVTNDIYYKTNNIYSLYLAKNYLLQEDTLLLESDLIFDSSILNKLLNNSYPSLALVAKYESWMDGTVVTIDSENSITGFYGKNQFMFEYIKSYYKTVNIYKFSKEFSNSHYVPFLEAYYKALGDNQYYEQVLKVITLLEKPEIKVSVIDNEKWYEIDDIQDLDIAESLFTNSIDDKLTKIQNRYGGYWRYPTLMDFCYLVNPFYPSQKLLEEIKSNFERLITEYPSGMSVNSLLVAKYFGIHQNNIVVGNGAAELIKSLFENLEGRLGLILPTFEEYPNRFPSENKVIFTPQNNNFMYSADDLIDFFSSRKIDTLLLINPDNPSGNYLKKQDIIKLAEWSKKQFIKLIIDESFVDFVDFEENASLFNQNFIDSYDNIVLIKSISKSYGVPGLRLGVLASKNNILIEKIKMDVAIWNINSFAEFFLQIFEKYINDYKKAISEFYSVRAEYINKLNSIRHLRVIPSQANYLLCELLDGYKAIYITRILLDKYNILIKDLSSKKGFTGEYIRIAIKKPEQNTFLVNALKNELT